MTNHHQLLCCHCRGLTVSSGADNWYDISGWGWLQRRAKVAGRQYVFLRPGKTTQDYLDIFLKDIPQDKI